MIWLQLIAMFSQAVTTGLAIYILFKQRELRRHIVDNTTLFRRLVPRIERLEKKMNIKEAP